MRLVQATLTCALGGVPVLSMLLLTSLIGLVPIILPLCVFFVLNNYKNLHFVINGNLLKTFI